MQWGGKRPKEPVLGLRVLVGQFFHEVRERRGKMCLVDEAERRNFERSKYIPGNGVSHRLGKTK